MKKHKIVPSGIVVVCFAICALIMGIIAIAATDHTIDPSSSQAVSVILDNSLLSGTVQKLANRLVLDSRHLCLKDGRCICGQCPIVSPNTSVLPRPNESQLIPAPPYQYRESTVSTVDERAANQEAIDQKQELSDPTQIGSQLPSDIKNYASENVLSDHDNSQPREPDLPTSPSPATSSINGGFETSWSTLNFDEWGIAYDSGHNTYYYTNNGCVYRITDQSFHADVVGTHPGWLDGIKMTFVGNLP